MHTHIYDEFVSISLHMHEAWPWLCSFHFISVYRLFAPYTFFLKLRCVFCGFIDVVGPAHFYTWNRWKNAGLKTTDSLLLLLLLLPMCMFVSVSFSKCTLQAHEANVSRLFQLSNERERWLKRFPRNFGISVRFKLCGGFNFFFLRWPFGSMSSCIGFWLLDYCTSIDFGMSLI